MYNDTVRLAAFPYNVFQAAQNGSPEETGGGIVYVARFGGYGNETTYRASEADVLAYRAARVAAHEEWLAEQGLSRPIPAGWGGH